jgi:preprotein translocase subunit SecA
MGPVYRFLGLSVGNIRESMPVSERRTAYNCDITYLTAKEAGFDYLRSFLCIDKTELVQRGFNFAVIDEADSILIDEARIPLVIAGTTGSEMPQAKYMAELIKGLVPLEDYELDEYERNVYLTEAGLKKVESILNKGNLYDGHNTETLVDLNNALHAHVLLKRDVDYIVRNDRIEIVDEFTGRIADRRHWPQGLQEAIEYKEGLKAEAKGRIIASVTLQNFIRMYSKVCGMTGTALTSSNELFEFYKLKTYVIPTNRPCIRKDCEDLIFTHKEAKYKAVVREISIVHSSGQPILIGTASVSESEMLADMLQKEGVSCQILNAKNDRLEAQIVAKAGMWGSVTVSTNMAGRGTDIKLGGEEGIDREKIIALGGLYVLGTNRHESRRIDNQLRGRAGRQGDPGISRFFISLEDDLMKRYRLQEMMPASIYPSKQEEPIENKFIKKQIAGVQRIVEGQNFEIRRTLDEYAIVIEKQRKSISDLRFDILTDLKVSRIMETKLPEKFADLRATLGYTAVRKAEKQASLYFINSCWADYLDYLSYIKENIHLVHIGGKMPLTEYNRAAVNSYANLMQDIENSIIKTLETAEITENGINLEKEGLKVPSSTWTYLVNDSPEQAGINPITSNPAIVAANVPLWIATALFYRIFGKKSNVK